MERICVYPGSFDPITVGHMDIIRRSAALFDRVIVAVLHNPAKQGCFPLEERLAMIREACADIPQVQVDSFGGLLVDYCRGCGAQVVVRGLRAVSDFESEFQMAQVNHQILPTLETLFMMTLPKYRRLIHLAHEGRSAVAVTDGSAKLMTAAEMAADPGSRVRFVINGDGQAETLY